MSRGRQARRLNFPVHYFVWLMDVFVWPFKAGVQGFFFARCMAAYGMRYSQSRSVPVPGVLPAVTIASFYLAALFPPTHSHFIAPAEAWLQSPSGG